MQDAKLRRKIFEDKALATFDKMVQAAHETEQVEAQLSKLERENKTTAVHAVQAVGTHQGAS